MLHCPSVLDGAASAEIAVLSACCSRRGSCILRLWICSFVNVRRMKKLRSDNPATDKAGSRGRLDLSVVAGACLSRVPSCFPCIPTLQQF